MCFVNPYLDNSISTRWPQLFSVECREAQKRKRWDRTMYLFCVYDAFDRAIGGYVVNVYRLSRLSYVVNLSSIIGLINFKADLFTEERSQLVKFSKIGHTGLKSNNRLSGLFIVKQVRNLQYGDVINCVLKLVELGNYLKSKGGVFEIVSDRGGRLESLY